VLTQHPWHMRMGTTQEPRSLTVQLGIQEARYRVMVFFVVLAGHGTQAWCMMGKYSTLIHTPSSYR
jgi:hypothetical protein